MTQPSILLIGAGGHAIACLDVIEQEDRFRIAGFVGVAAEVGSEIAGYPVLATDAQLPELVARYGNAIIAIGQIKTPDARMDLFARLSSMGWRMPTIVSPRAYVSSRATLGPGTIVMHAAVINAQARIGCNCIVNTKALVEHDVLIADHCHVATGAVVNGGASVGTGSFIGSNSSIRQGISVGERCVVGMGQCVVADCPDGTSLPARRVVA